MRSRCSRRDCGGAVDHYDGDRAVPLEHGYALGAYAIDADPYTELALRRWDELLEGTSERFLD
ncbi:hypothetical protein [Nocardia sp. CC227C]|uniref:hypothetical protein n=1 Tax=Nocardia sp. CC227C TaxID=3044562 RepID=UPI00278BDB7C|nr:hypothetical protein [Nocardia sp. CC227C]